MKRAAAIVLSLMFLWLQAMSSAQTSFLPTKATRPCCGCQQRDCCVTPATPDPQSLPATVAATGSQNHLSVLVSTLVAWTLPATAPAQVLVSASAPLLAPGVPLFTRYCARLI
jgi:hypothetical protein